MPDENSKSGPAELLGSITIPDNSDQFEKVGQFVLALIRRTAGLVREASQDPPNTSPKDQIEETLLTEAQRKLRDRTDEAEASYRKFVDAAATLQTANEEIFNLRKALEDKDRELTELRRESLQMLSYMRALVEKIDEKRSRTNGDPPAMSAMN
jgi:chromosome segregation ATPase